MARKRKELPASDPGDELVRLADELALTTLAARWKELLQEVEEQAPSYTDFALRLLRAEAEARSTRRHERALKRSRLGVCEGLDGFDFRVRPELRASTLKELLRCAWARERRPLVLVGKQGTGKTRVAKALSAAALDEGYSVLYVEHTQDMLEELRNARVDGSHGRALRRYVKPDVLTLDELGYQRLDEDATNDLYRLVAARHKAAATVVVSNTGFSNWHRFFPSRAQAVATVDRLIDEATILRFTGKSFRTPRDIHGAPLEGEDEDG